jgi:hypothetical protein
VTPTADRRPSGEAALAIVLFALGVVVAGLVIRPLHVGAVGSDTASSVLYFDRIMSGQRLELFLGTTPKPFLTFVYGPLYSLTHDWRAISWLAIVVYGAAVGGTTVLARRVTGSWVGAAFVATGLLASAGLLRDASLAYGGTWSLLGWAIAGLAVTASRPRYATAGVALAVGALIRPETLLIVGLGGLVLVARTIAARQGRTAKPPRAAWWILLGLVAVPIAGLHDLLLAGDPLYSLRVPLLGTDIRAVQTTATAFAIVRDHLGGLAPLGVLAAIGLVVLVVRRQWPILVGLLAIGPGVAALVVGLGLRHVYVLDRYLLPVDLAVVFAAGIGVAAVTVPLVVAAVRLDPRTALAASVGGAVLVALATGPSIGPLDRALSAQIGAARGVVVDFGAAKPTLERALEAIPLVRQRPASADPSAVHGIASPILLVPAAVLPMAAVELDLSLDRIVRSQPQLLSSDGSWPAPGQLVVHDATVDAQAERLAFFEVAQPLTTGRIRVVPLLADPARRLWVLRIEAP